MTSIENSRGLRFSRYFPNHAEYASQVRRPLSAPPVHRRRRKSLVHRRRSRSSTHRRRREDEAIQTDESEDIYRRSLSLSTASTQTKKLKLKNKWSQINLKPSTKEQDSNTESILLSENHCSVYSQTDLPSKIELGIQTDTEVFNSQHANAFLNPNLNVMVPTMTATSNSDAYKSEEIPTKKTMHDYDVYDSGAINQRYLKTIVDEIEQIGNPRMIFSLHGLNDLQDQERLKDVLVNVVNRAGRCGFLYQSQETALVQKILKVKKHLDCLQGILYGYSDLDDTDNEQTAEKKDSEQTAEKKATDSFTFDRLLVESYINRQMKIPSQHKKENNVRVPVVLFLHKGDLTALEHVAEAIDEDISVVVLKGSGGAADLIALCMEDISNLKTASPVMMEIRLSNELYAMLESVVTKIVEKKWLVNIFDLEENSYDILWDKITNGIVRAWSYEQNKDLTDNRILARRPIFNNEIISISQYVGSIPGISKLELFGGYNLKKDNNKNSNQAALFYALLGNDIRTVHRIFKNCTNVTVTLKRLNTLYKQKMTMNPDTKTPNPAVIVCKDTCPDECHFLEKNNNINNTKFKNSLEASYSILNRLMKGLGLSKLGILTCCKVNMTNDNDEEGKVLNSYKETHNSQDNQDTVYRPLKNTNERGDNPDEVDNTDEKACETGDTKNSNPNEKATNSDDNPDEAVTPDAILLCEILTSNIDLAGSAWTHSENPLLTALFCSLVLSSMGKIADKTFQASNELYDHSIRFARRAEHLLEKLYAHDVGMATEALEYVTVVWEYSYSALHFGQQFGMEEFISHPSTQKEANDRLHRYRFHRQGDQTNDRLACFAQTKKALKYLNAPITKIWIQFVMFIASLLMFSIFLLTDLNFNTFSSLEIIVFVIMVGDFIEETWNMFRCHDKSAWSPQTILLHLLDAWNFLDMLCYVLYFIGFGIHLSGSEDLIIHVRRLYSVALFIMFLRILNIFLMIKQIGIIVIMVKEMLVDLFKYLVILVVLIFAAGVVYHANVYPNHPFASVTSDIRYWRIWTLLKIPYWQVYGELNLDTLEGYGDCNKNDTLWRTDPTVERCPEGDWITTFIAAFYMMLTNWLLLNTVIAMFSSRYEHVIKNSEQKWRYHRHSVIINYEHWIPSPFNFIVRPIMGLSQLKVCPCFKHTKKSDTSKMVEIQKQFAQEIIADEIRQSKNDNDKMD